MRPYFREGTSWAGTNLLVRLSGAGKRTTQLFNPVNQPLVKFTGTARTTYVLDVLSQRTQKQAPAGATYYDWDAVHKLVQVTPVAGPVTMTYNGDGNRTRVSSLPAMTLGGFFHGY